MLVLEQHTLCSQFGIEQLLAFMPAPCPVKRQRVQPKAKIHNKQSKHESCAFDVFGREAPFKIDYANRNSFVPWKSTDLGGVLLFDCL